MTMAESVEETLSFVDLRPEDAALAAIALEYARTIDRASVIAAAARKAMESLDPLDVDGHEQIKLIMKRVSAHAAVSDLGPKLLAALDALMATPKSRVVPGARPQRGPIVNGGPLAQLRAGTP